VSGDIIEFDRDIEDYTISSDGQNNTSEYIGEIEAKAAALEHAGVTEEQANFIRIELDYDDGRTAYDIEFHVGNIEYDYEIDAMSGDIISFNVDND
jgi:uncharacterized membrane protein YkoI